MTGDGIITQQGLSGEGKNKKTLTMVVVDVKNLNKLIIILGANLEFLWLENRFCRCALRGKGNLRLIRLPRLPRRIKRLLSIRFSTRLKGSSR